MVDRDPFKYNDSSDKDESPFFAKYDLVFEQNWSRIEMLSRAHSLLGRANDLDNDLKDKLTKRFLSRSGGDAEDGKYRFHHLRLKLKPKNRIATDVRVVALRFPTDEHYNLFPDKLYIAYEDSYGEHATYLSADQYSKIDPKVAFSEPDAGTVLPPCVEGLTAASEIDELLLQSILRANPDFELDLQDNKSDVRP